MRPRIHVSPEETLQYHREAARRTGARRYIVVCRALRWLKRHHPEVLQRMEDEAYRKVPNPSGRKRSMRIAA